jgi:23S rRNA (cytosine1962-C5)-methyltransferase
LLVVFHILFILGDVLFSEGKYEYQLLDSGGFRKLEAIGPYRLIRPAASAIWRPQLGRDEWGLYHGEFKRTSGGEGRWLKGSESKALPQEWQITLGPLTVIVRPTDFGHVGFFPEHHQWQELQKCLVAYGIQKREFKLLNLFAYTGVTSLMAAHLGAKVTHVDASKTSVNWARENGEASQLNQFPIRWIVEDVQKYLLREGRRQSLYQGIILDPPSFGRGPKGEPWKIDEHLPELLESLKQVMAEDFCFLQLSAHSLGLSPLGLKNCVEDVLGSKCSEHLSAFEMSVADVSGRRLPSGVCCLYSNPTLSQNF